jgi:2-polyprenyl-3-methyl-5-hydroxy-6-metoxy-1,4-benzoquinol methylase
MSAPAPRHTYDYEVDLTREVAGTKVARFVGRNRRVLELGAGAGAIARVLKEHNGCRVTAIEKDPTALPLLAPHCERVCPLDLNEAGWAARVCDQGRFETIVAADVLEHLYDPWSVLREAKSALGDGGDIVVSLPHAGHNAVLACLAAGDFEYRDWGLLDRTHIRFFGLRNIERLFIDAGLKIVAAEFVVTPPEQTELAERWQQTPAAFKKGLAHNRFGSVYQVVVKAREDADPQSGLRLDSLPVAAPAEPLRRTLRRWLGRLMRGGRHA